MLNALEKLSDELCSIVMTLAVRYAILGTCFGIGSYGFQVVTNACK